MQKKLEKNGFALRKIYLFWNLLNENDFRIKVTEVFHFFIVD